MKAKLKKWGNSAAVDVREEQGRIVIEPVRRKVYKLDELLGSITSKNIHLPVATGAPLGREVW